jgi:acyl carrier protein
METEKQSSEAALQAILADAHREIGQERLLSELTVSTGYAPTQITPERALACLLNIGEDALEGAANKSDVRERQASFRLAALSFKYAYLLRDQGIIAQPIPSGGKPADVRLARVLAELFHLDRQQPITENSSLEDIGVAVGLSGAVDLFMLIFKLQEVFHVQISDIDAEQFSTVGDIQKFLQGREAL